MGRAGPSSTWVEKQSAATLDSAARTLAGEGPAVALFNAANWRRTDPLRVKLPADTSLAGATCEAAGDGTTFCRLDVPATGIVGANLKCKPAAAPKSISLPPTIETQFYSAQIDPVDGALVELEAEALRAGMLGGPANVIVAEKQTSPDDPGDFTEHARNARAWPLRAISSHRHRDGRSAGHHGGSAGEFYGGGACNRVTRFFKDHPRIEFETELNDVPNMTVVVAEFPLAESRRKSVAASPLDSRAMTAWSPASCPAVRWSDYATPGQGGVALLDRGFSGREINGRVPILYLLNCVDKYRGYTNAWLSGQGRHHLEYALVAHDADWAAARVP